MANNKRPRGAFPSPRYRLAAATPHTIIGPTPPQVIYKPSKLSFWLNDKDGDCVTAEEAFAKACHQPEIFISDAEVEKWAQQPQGPQWGQPCRCAGLMQKKGFQQGGHTYDDGPHTAVDWTNAALLQNAIAHGPVKIGVAADQLDSVVPNPPTNGWFATGFKEDTNEDHCVSLCGYGSFSWLAQSAWRQNSCGGRWRNPRLWLVYLGQHWNHRQPVDAGHYSRGLAKKSSNGRPLTQSPHPCESPAAKRGFF